MVMVAFSAYGTVTLHVIEGKLNRKSLNAQMGTQMISGKENEADRTPNDLT